MVGQWGKKIIPTFLSIIFLYYCVVISYDKDVELIQIKILYDIIFLLASTLLIFISLQRQNNIQIFKEINLWIVVIVSIVSATILSLYFKEDSILIFRTLFVGPIYESLFFHEIIFRLIKNEYELKKKIFIFFILSVLIGFFLLYLIRLKWNENSKFWYIVNSKYVRSRDTSFKPLTRPFLGFVINPKYTKVTEVTA